MSDTQQEESYLTSHHMDLYSSEDRSGKFMMARDMSGCLGMLLLPFVGMMYCVYRIIFG